MPVQDIFLKRWLLLNVKHLYSIAVSNGTFIKNQQCKACSCFSLLQHVMQCCDLIYFKFCLRWTNGQHGASCSAERTQTLRACGHQQRHPCRAQGAGPPGSGSQRAARGRRCQHTRLRCLYRWGSFLTLHSVRDRRLGPPLNEPRAHGARIWMGRGGQHLLGFPNSLKVMPAFSCKCGS